MTDFCTFSERHHPFCHFILLENQSELAYMKPSAETRHPLRGGQQLVCTSKSTSNFKFVFIRSEDDVHSITV